EIGLGLLGWTNGENAHEVATVRDRESFEAVAAALKLEDLAPEPLAPAAPEPVVQAAPEPVEPVLSVAALEAAVAAVALPAAPRARAEGPASLPGLPFRPAGE